MSLHRFEIQARLEDGMTEGRVGAGALQLVTVCLCDEGEVSDGLGEPFARPPVRRHVRPSRARELAFCLLELAERRSEEAQDESGAVGCALECVSRERVDDRRCCACHCHTDRVCWCRRGVIVGE